MPCQRSVCGRSMFKVSMCDGPDDRESVSLFRQLGKLIRQVSSTDSRCDGSKFAAHRGWGMRFRIPEVLLAGTAPKEDDNTRFGSPEVGE